ncbi:hypothetical protein [Vibrio methylphosphonaticus]|uniref:hypothetical protein n=1 Tax=Vibrio methylphosphonaticus TaxID=2946866 RepID=UPI00202A988F|nr:hypothetical protein [Vibrio methylphosphonaticus]MCL9774244.1 hypothetical protein [Vibrio methylphosphonaticus]
MKALKFVVATVITLVLVGCGRVHPVLNFENEPVAYDLTATQVKSVITAAAENRGWVVSESKAGVLNATISVRSHEAEIDIPYTKKYYSITYVDSKNLKAADGEIHRNYNRWINNLNTDIKTQLAATAASK